MVFYSTSLINGHRPVLVDTVHFVVNCVFLFVLLLLLLTLFTDA